ncbi:hypothetical protein [Candidatus Nanohalococcus occultus]|uniref:hypothetical protein n=1 Tax=Candidatus Nanohalococcus occultus TaxID=2978047 RepID=UPI0039E04F7C
MKKISLLLVTLIMFTAAGTAVSWQLPQVFPEYGGGVVSIDSSSSTPDIVCNPDLGSGPTSCPDNPTFSIENCDGVSETMSRSGNKYSLTFESPEFSSCSWGKHRIVIKDSSGSTLATGGNVEVQAGGLMGQDHSPSIGKYLYIRGDINRNQDKLHSFLISNSKWDNPREPYSGSIAIDEVDSLGNPNEKCIADYYAPGIINGSSIDSSLEDLDLLRAEINEQCKESNGPLALLNQDFDSYQMTVKDPQVGGSLSKFWNWGLDGWSPVHSSTSYRPQGEILLGNYHPDKDSTRFAKDRELFFVCRSGMDGYTASLNSVNSQSLWRCDADSGDEVWRDSEKNDWEPVVECTDGVDNNGNGQIDEDAYCDGPNDNNEGADTGCGPSVKQNSSGLHAVWTSNTCHDSSKKLSDYENYQESPDTFECSETNPEGFSGSRNDLCQRADHSSHGSIIPAVEFYPTENYLLYEAQQRLGRSPENGDVWESDFVNAGGFTSKYQTLHQAEMKYDGGTSASSCENCHDADNWQSKGVENTGDGYTPGDDAEASWDAKNAGLNEGEGVNQTGEMFPGGFAANCPGDLYWSETGNGYACTTGSGGATSMRVQFFKTTSDDLSGSFVGFKIDQEDALQWENSYQHGLEGGDDYQRLQVQSMCFLGKDGVAVPDSPDEYVNITQTVHSDRDTYVVAEVPDRDFSTDSSSKAVRKQYTCVFGFVQSDTTSLIPGDDNHRTAGVENGPGLVSVRLDYIHRDELGDLSQYASNTGSVLFDKFISESEATSSLEKTWNNPLEYYVINRG